MLKNKVVLFALSLFLTACSSSDRELAKNGDWYQVGFSDGIKGFHTRSFDDLQKLGQVNQAEYDQGYIDAIKEYCNPNFAYQIGFSGQYYEGVCEGTADAQKFRMEWQRGWQDFQ